MSHDDGYANTLPVKSLLLFVQVGTPIYGPVQRELF